MADNALAKQVGKKMPERRKTRLEQIADEIQAYGGRVRDDFMAGAERSAQGLGDIVERGDVLTGIPRLALGGTSWMGAPVSAALSPVLGPILQPVGEAVNTYVGQPVEDLTGYPADITNDLAMTGLTLGAVKGLGVTRPYLARAADQVEGMANRAGYTLRKPANVYGSGPMLTRLADDAEQGKIPAMETDADGVLTYHGTVGDAFDSVDFQHLGKLTERNSPDFEDGSFAQNLSKLGFWTSEEGPASPKLSRRYEKFLPFRIKGETETFNSLEELNGAINEFGGPEKYRQYLLKNGYGNIRVKDEEFGVTSYIALTPENAQAVKAALKPANVYGSGPTLTPLVDEADGGIDAWHGSPHTFDKFSMDKIGTGEGAQAFGHGLYFAEAEDVAKTYRGMLSDQPQALPAIPWQQRMDWTEAQDDAYTLADRALEELQIDIMQGGSSRPDWSRLTDKVRQIAPRGKEDEIASALDELANRYGWKDFVNRNPGSMYQVRLNVKPDELLDWDKPLSEQPQNLLRRLENSPHFSGGGSDWGDMTTKDIVESLSGQDLISLKDQGIKGIRYKDAGSRGAEGGTYNYVIFDDSIIDILKRYGIPMTAAAGGGMMVMGQDMPPEVASQIGG